MNMSNTALEHNSVLSRAFESHKLQKAAYLVCQNPTLEKRLRNLENLERMLLKHKGEIASASCRDYGSRSIEEVLLAEIFATVDGIRYARKKLRKWMKPQKRGTSIWFFGAKNTVLPQPKGVVGIISPWNYPLFLFISPVTSALAAGNRCMIKMAKESSHLAKLMERLVLEYFSPETLTIIPEISGGDFTKIPFDHLVFTGSANTARHVMAAASKNLTPVTLELGGKSPTIVDPAFDHQVAAKRIMNFKTFNGGQTCVAPDYVFVHKDKLELFLQACKEETQKRYSSISSHDYTGIITGEALQRLEHYLEDAKQKGAKVYNLMGEACDRKLDEHRKLSPHAITHVSDNAEVMQEEIFGPLLPILTYENIDEAIDYVNDRPRPLGLYLFSYNKSLQQKVITNTLSGAVAINDCALQVAQHDMPFGGIGESGMGHYHAYEGFKEFSKMRPIFKQARLASIELLYPPYGKRFALILDAMLKLKI